MKSLVMIMCCLSLFACTTTTAHEPVGTAGVSGNQDDADGGVVVSAKQSLLGNFYRVPSNVKGGLPANAFQSQIIAICTASYFGTDEIFDYRYKSPDVTILDSKNWEIQTDYYGLSFGSLVWDVTYIPINPRGGRGAFAWVYVPPNATPKSARIEFYNDPITKNIGECIVNNQVGSMQF